MARFGWNVSVERLPPTESSRPYTTKIDHIRKLAEKGTLKNLREAKAFLAGPNPEVKKEALRAVFAIGEREGHGRTLPIFAEHLKKGSVEVRELAADLVGRTAHPRVFAVLSPHAKDYLPNVRIKVMAGLGRTGNEKAVRILAKALKDHSLKVQRHAKEGLLNLHSALKRKKVRDSYAKALKKAARHLSINDRAEVFDTALNAALNAKVPARRIPNYVNMARAQKAAESE